ncbi:MAG: hypothetical protein HXS44_03025, partial [Theionarchaea archaeon]|nr:hypothetical protein [Theionarchaea archaeon]
MKKEVLVLTCVLILNISGIRMGEEDGDLIVAAVSHEVLKRGVQDFSDGEIVIVEKPVDVVVEDEYVSVSGSNYECFIKKELSENFLTFQKDDAFIVYQFPESQPFGEVDAVEGDLEEGISEGKCVSRSFVYRNVSEGMDIRYSFLHYKVLEEVILHKFQNVEIVEEFSIQNVWLSEKEGGIYFYHVKTGRLAFFIPKPVMYEEGDREKRCFGIYYKIEKAQNGYVIRKIIDKEGLEWLMDTERLYPVIIDSTTEGGIQDPWEESGLLPYGQYFQNLNEYVSPCNGSLTVTQTDLYLPGRGMDLIISRVYTTPQLFSIDEGFTPTEEDPPWKIANGWRYDLPGITENYLYLWGGRMYKPEWGTDPPECVFWCFPPLEPGEEVFNNHKGDHFRLIKHVDGSYTLYLKDGRICQFSSPGDIQSITDVYGNEITFSGNVITDTMGRVVSLSPTGISYGQQSVNYTIQYVDYNPLLTAVTDCLGRVTHFYYEHANKWLLTKVVYPTQGYTEYVYGMKERRICNEDPCHIWDEDCHEVPDCYQSLYQFRVTVQRVYTDTLVKVRTFSYVEDWENTLESTEKTKDELSYIQSETHFVIGNGKIKKRTVKDYTGTQVEKVVYTYNAQGETVINQCYKGNTDEVSYQEFSQYDEWGNQIYARNSLGYEMFASYVNTSSEGKFTDYSGNSFEFSNQFYTNNVTGMYNKVAGVSMITGGASSETYYQYDSSGNMVETRDILDGKSYLVYYGLFDENGQVSFPFTSDTPINDAILRIASLPTLNSVLQSETHTASDHPWYDNTGYWQNQYYYAHWIHGVGGEVEEGYDIVGPFTHYPGTPGYINYETWVSELTQYVKTNYTIYENVSPLACSYNLNSGSWVEIISELGNGTAQTTIPSGLILQENTIQFQESSIYSTRFQWMLLIPVQNEPETHYKDFEYDLYGNLISA